MKTQLKPLLCRTQRVLWAALIGFGLLTPTSAQAATFTVTKLADTNDGACDSDCSLREAITAANTAADSDFINFADSVRGAIDLTSTLPNLSTSMGIYGPGAQLLTLRRSMAPGTPDFRIFSSWGVVALSGLTLSNGRVTNPNLGFGEGDGGAISTMDDGLLTISYCVFSGNSALQGGAIHNRRGTVNIYRSTFSGNTATYAGGAIFNQPSQSLPNAHMLISNCTLSGNTATQNAGGAILNAFPLTIESSTIADNTAPTGAGIQNLYTVVMNNTIMANAGGNIVNTSDSGVKFTSQGYNLATDGGAGVLTGPGDLINTNPQLGLLADNGGPTPTRTLLPDSPARNAGDPAIPPVVSSYTEADLDQRGSFSRTYFRVLGGRMDIGALESDTGDVFVVTKLADTNDGVCDADCSLREAFNATKNNPVGDTTGIDIITFAPNVRGTIVLTMGEGMSTYSPIKLVGPGAKLLAISGSGNSPIFSIGGSPSTISGLTLRDGNIPDAATGNDSGAAISNSGALTVRDCFFSNNKAYAGGAISNSGRLVVENCAFANNTATAWGGAIWNQGSSLSLRNCTLSGNSGIDGGGVANFKGTLTVEHCTITKNFAHDFGAGVYHQSQELATFSHSIIAGNSTFYADVSPSDVFASTGPDSPSHAQSNGYNLIGGDSGSLGSRGFEVFTNHDLTGITDPRLGPLADNGGPTPTMALLPDSPTINAGNPNFSPPPATDQRGLGFERVRGGRIDIGAFEVQSVTLSVTDTRVFDEGSAAAPAVPNFTVALDFASNQTVTVNYTTTDGSAKAGSDYVAKSGKLTFLPGETKKLVSVKVIGDSVPEPSETFFLDLKTPTNATIADGRGVASIRNDDGPSLNIFDAVPVDEGNSGTIGQKFIVRLSAASADTVTVNWATASDTAGPDDYVAASGTLTFAPGQTSKLITIQVNGDTTAESNETYKVTLSKPAYAVLGDALAVGTIRNDDAAPLLFQNDEPSQ